MVVAVDKAQQIGKPGERRRVEAVMLFQVGAHVRPQVP
jgi:hypothetical protein